VRKLLITSLEVNGDILADLLGEDIDSPRQDTMCALCEETSGTFLCKNCQANLCLGCKDVHLGQKLSKLHTVIPLSEYAMCSIHLGEELQYSCDCGSLICSKCAILLHGDGHKKTTVEEVASKKRVDIVTEASELHAHMAEVLAQATKHDMDFANHMKGLQQIIDALTAKLIESIKRQVRDRC